MQQFAPDEDGFRGVFKSGNWFFRRKRKRASLQSAGSKQYNDDLYSNFS
jgi:hypothetical protein